MEAAAPPPRRRRARRRSPTCWPCGGAVRRPRRRRATRPTARGTTSPSPRSATIVREIGLGLIDLGIAPGDRVCLLANTRPEWTLRDFAITSAGGVVVPIYPTNSPEECEWVAGNSEAVAVVCEDADAGREDRRRPRPACRTCATIIVIDPRGRHGRRDRARRGARARPRRATPAELDARAAAVDARRHVHDHLHVGDDRPAEGLRAHPRQLPRARSTCARRSACCAATRTHLPLPPARALLRAADPAAPSTSATTIAYFGGDPNQIVAELQEIKPTYLPCVPRIFEKIYTLVMASQPRTPERR